MQEPKELPLNLLVAWNEARSFPGEPAGTYIGEVETEHRTYYFYQQGDHYWYDTDYDRQIRKEQKEKGKERKWRKKYRWHSYRKEA